MRTALAAIVLSAVLGFGQTCVGGKWDITSNIWFRDCTSGDNYDGFYGNNSLGRSYSPNTVTGDTAITLADGSHQTVYWRLSYWDNISDNTLPVPDSIPLMAGVHEWTTYTTLDELFNAGNQYMNNDPGAIRVIGLTFSINISGNNSGTWWWGSSVSGVPTPWAEEAVVRIINERMTDACQLLANAGNSALSGKHVDANRVYIHGHSMGGTGAYRIGVKHPELFAAIFCHAGFADFKGPCGAFTDGFNTMVGTSGQQCRGLDGNQYVARDYTDMSWFVGTHHGASWETALGQGKKFEPPYVFMRHGTADNAVDIASADRLHVILNAGKWGHTYQRDGGGHSDSNGARPQWMLNFRKNQSFCAFTNNTTSTSSSINYLNQIGWQPSSIVDETNHYEVQLTSSSGTTDVTLRRLQNFVVAPGKEYHYWIGSKSGNGTAVSADVNGALTLTGITAGSKIIVEPDVLTKTDAMVKFINHALTLFAIPNPFNPSTVITCQGFMSASKAVVDIYTQSGKLIHSLSTDGAALHRGVVWNASSEPSGVYIFRIQGSGRTAAGYITLIK